MGDGVTSLTDSPAHSRKAYRGHRRNKKGRSTGHSTCADPNSANNDSASSSNRRRNGHSTDTEGTRHYCNDASSQISRRGRPIEETNSAFHSESLAGIDGVTQQSQMTQLYRRGVNRGFSTHRVQGSNYCQRSGHTFNPFAPPFISQSLLAREQATSIHYDGSCTRISDSRFFEGNQKYRGSKQFTRTHNKTYNHEERGNRRNQEGNLISGSTERSTFHQNSRRPFRLHQRRAKNNLDAQDESMRERLIQQLEDRCYECAICCQVILPKEAIWSCRICYQMFHISGGCIINWAKKSKEDDNRWRCPTCQTKCDAIPYNYFCFCGKQRNPTAHVGEIPHSCGNICGGKRSATCPHPCNEVCHPGPCPECPVMLTRTCNCGNVEMAVRCGSDVETKCDKVCDLLLECGIHRCTRVCHEGECGPCKVMTQQSCFCGSSSRKILCWEKRSEKYSCGSPCIGIYTCGVHPCTRNCHLADESGCGPCPYSPERITHCACGLWTLKELGLERISCLDPIPTCGNLCRKVLKCGTDEKKHRCRSMCHTGECPPCELNTSIVCRCKQVKRTLTCVEYLQFNCENEFLCSKRCKKRKSCGIHKCQELCCVQTEHICLQICNKRLSCGLHFCESICHAGQCPRCLNSSFEEQFCHCGRTVRLPPVPCGSSLPECSELCARPHRCSHPVTHRCHGEQHCPPCTVLVEKMCYGNHEIRRNVPCHIDAVSCGRPCGKPLTCGAHYCSRNCHSGDCVKNGEKCTRSCMVLRRPCEHPCALPCHGSNVCPESDCQYLVNVTCECGKRKSQMKCSDFEKLVNRLRAIDAESTEGNENLEFSGVGAMRRSASMEKLNCMSCDDECKKVARNKKFAEALELVTNEDGDLEREPTITFTEYLKAELRSNASFVIEVERTFLELLGKLGAPTYLGTSLNHNFPPMSVEKRRFIHEYAGFFLYQSIGVDKPPKRSVIITAKRGISRAPLVLLTSLQRHPSVLNTRGSITLRGNINDTVKVDETHEETREESHSGSSMKTLRGSRPVKKRVAPQVSRPTPLPQFNHFAVLRSDDEEYESVSADHNAQKDVILVHERGPHWWSDEEEVVSPGNAFEIVSLMEEIVLKICNDMSFGSHNEGRSCKDSWCDNE